MNPSAPSEASRAGAFAFPGDAAFTWDPLPWPGLRRMVADRGALRDAEARVAAGGALVPRMAWWTWDQPTISVGRLQSKAAVLPLGLPVVRRPTGGWAILHDGEWTYSALVPHGHPRLGGSLDASTRAIVGVVAAALERAYGIVVDPRPGPAVRVAPPDRAHGGQACFVRTLGYELAVGGRKLMGSAQRRGRATLLQQGSLLVGPGHERLARHLGGGPDEEAALAARAVTLTELLGYAPDPVPFRRALASAWTGAASGVCEAETAALDSAQGRT
jgi:lipoate-protein ligase A